MLIWVAYFVQLIAGSILYVLLVPFYAWKFGSRKSRLAMALEYVLLACVCGAFFSLASSDVVLTFWFYPLVVMNVLTNVRGIASHAIGDVENVYLSSRTISCSRWTAWLLMHENYHLEHHLFPKVPSYFLPKLHRLIWCRLPQAAFSRSYLHFLINFFKAALERDLRPMGVVHPIAKASEEGQC
ncbi:MAG: fatty acid desaturase [Verrucomicrobiales bacterium]